MYSQTVLIEVYEDPEEDIKWIKANLTQYLAPGKKKELILRWADDLVQLAKQGIYKEPLTHISTTITTHLKSEDLKHALPYVHEVLPFKFKDPVKMTRLDEDLFREEILTQDSSKVLLADDVKKTNINYCLRLDRTIKVLQSLKHSLETDTLYETEIPEKELEEFLVRWDGAIDRCAEILDGRHQVMPSTQHILFYALSVSTLNYTYSTYVRFIRDFERMTPKQSGKILRGHVTKMELLYEPKNRQEARHAGFYGIQCEICGSWRQEYRFDSNSNRFMLYCYKGMHWNEVVTEKLMK